MPLYPPGGVVTIGTTQTITASKTLNDGVNIILGTSSGSQVGSGSTQKLGLWGATPVAQIAGNVDVLAGLVTVGMRAASSNPPLNLGTGLLTSGAAIHSPPAATVGITVNGATADMQQWLGTDGGVNQAVMNRYGQLSLRPGGLSGLCLSLYNTNYGLGMVDSSDTEIFAGNSSGVGISLSGGGSGGTKYARFKTFDGDIASGFTSATLRVNDAGTMRFLAVEMAASVAGKRILQVSA